MISERRTLIRVVMDNSSYFASLIGEKSTLEIARAYCSCWGTSLVGDSNPEVVLTEPLGG